MKFGVREITDVVLRSKGVSAIGTQTFEDGEPVIYFDSAKTSTVESAATTVYATGGRGNTRLLAWEGEKTVTFTMEDALLSPLGFSILSGAGLIEASTEEKIYMHSTMTTVATVAEGSVSIDIEDALASAGALGVGQIVASKVAYGFIVKNGQVAGKLGKTIPASGVATFAVPVGTGVQDSDVITVLVDFYIEASAGATEMTITPDKFGGFYYLEASTLFRRQDTGKDMPAAFVIPKVKIQSNFSFAMASSGDPSTFTFTMDAFPDYTKFDQTKQVLFALQILE